MFQRLTNLTPENVERFSAEGNVRGLLRALRSNDPIIFNIAEQGLLQIQPPPLTEICKLLTEKRTPPALKQRAAGLLGKLRDSRAIPCLLDTLQSLPDRLEAENRTLSAILAQSLSTLEWAPSQDQTGARFWCAQEKWENCLSCQKAAIPTLIEELILIFQVDERYWSHQQQETVQIVGSVLNDLKIDAIPALLALITNPPITLAEEDLNRVKSQTAHLLEAMGSEVVPPLNAALRTSTDPAITRQLVQLAAALNDDRSVSPLIETLGQISKPMKSLVADALTQFDSQSAYLIGIQIYQHWINETVWEPHDPAYDRDRMNDTLVNLNYLERFIRGTHGEAVTALINSYKTALEGSEVFKRFEKMIVTINVAAIPALVHLLKSPNQIHQQRAVNVLEKLAQWHPSASTPEDQAYFAIAKRIRDSLLNEGIARADSGVCISLGQSAVAPLTHTLKNHNYQIRYDAAQTLERIAPAPDDPESAIDRYVALHSGEACMAYGSKAVKPLIRNLREAIKLESFGFNEEQRKQALTTVQNALVALGNESKVDLVVRLEDPQEIAIRPYLAQILMQIGSPAASLLRNAGRGLKDDDIRYEVTRILYHIAHQDPGPQRDFFYAKMKDNSPRIKNLAIQYATRNPDTRSLRALRAIAENPSEEKANRKTALQVIAAQGNPENLPVLLDFTQNEHRDLQIIAVQGIAQLGTQADTPEVLILLIDFLTGQQGSLQRGAANAMSAIGTPTIINTLFDYLTQLDQEIELAKLQPVTPSTLRQTIDTRELVIATLTKIGEGTIAAIVARKLDNKGHAFHTMIEIIARMEAGAARSFLNNELRAPTASQRYRAAKYLQALRWQPLPENDNCETLVQYAAAMSRWKQVLDYGDCAIEPLKETLITGDALSRQKAVELLDALDWRPSPADPMPLCQYWIIKGKYNQCYIVGAKAVEPLVNELKATQEQLQRSLRHGKGPNSAALTQRRTEIKNTLWGIGPEAVPALLAHFSLPETPDMVRAHISHVLMHLGGRQVKETVEKTLSTSNSPSIRRQSAWILGEMGAVSSVPIMLKMLQNAQTQTEMKIELLQALRKILKRPLEPTLIEQIRTAAANLIEWHEDIEQGIIESAIQVIRSCDRKLS